MKRFLLRATVVAVVIVAALGVAGAAIALNPGATRPTMAWTAAPEEVGATDTSELQSRALWAVLGVAVGCGVFGAFYLARRRAGHFDNPTWIAPISKMYSKDSPEAYGDVPADPHGSHH